MSRKQPDDDSGFSEKCERLEALLYRVFALAGEIAEDQGLVSPRPADELPGECIILRKGSVPDATGARQHHICHRFPGTLNYEGVEEERDGSRSPSAASAVQEPFSPGALALSLDAMVEGDSSDNASCCLDSGSATPFASRSPEKSTESSCLSSNEGVGEPGATILNSSSLQANSRAGSLEQQRRTTPPSKVASAQKPASPPVVENPEVRVGSVATQICYLPGSHAPPRQNTDTSRLTAYTSSSPTVTGGNQNETTGRDDQSPPPSKEWQVSIVPVPRSPSSPPTSPTLAKLEAIFPYSLFAGRNAASSLERSTEGSYTAYIGRPPPVDICPGYPHYPQEYGQDSQAVLEKSLQDYINEWDDLAARTPEADAAE